MDPEAFMAMVAKDAEERAARRAKSRQSAAKLKERANTFYKVGDWQRAIDLYSQAIEVCRDWNVLYSNRAQAYLHLGQAERALADCNTSLELLHQVQQQENKLLESKEEEKPEKATGDDNLEDDCNMLTYVTQSSRMPRPRIRPLPHPALAKAYLHQGKALAALDKPADALDAYAKSWHFYAPEASPDFSAIVHSSSDKGKSSLTDAQNNVSTIIKNSTVWPSFLAEYVAQAKAALEARRLELQVEEQFAACAIQTGQQLRKADSARTAEDHQDSGQMVIQLIAQLSRCGQPAAYYTAGMRHLTQLIVKSPSTAPNFAPNTTNLNEKPSTIESSFNSPVPHKSVINKDISTTSTVIHACAVPAPSSKLEGINPVLNEAIVEGSKSVGSTRLSKHARRRQKAALARAACADRPSTGTISSNGFGPVLADTTSNIASTKNSTGLILAPPGPGSNVHDLNSSSICDVNTPLLVKAIYSSDTGSSKGSSTMEARESLSPKTQLQTLFRMRSGFRVLAKQSEEIYDALVSNLSWSTSASGSGNSNFSPVDLAIDRLLALLQLASQLVKNCPANQISLMVHSPILVDIALGFSLHLFGNSADLSSDPMSLDIDNTASPTKDRFSLLTQVAGILSDLNNSQLSLNSAHLRRHLLHDVRAAGAAFLATMTDDVVGRSELLGRSTTASSVRDSNSCTDETSHCPGASRLLSSLAVCLSAASANKNANGPLATSSLLSPPTDSFSRLRGIALRRPDQKCTSAITPVLTTTGSVATPAMSPSMLATMNSATRVLENLTGHEAFLIQLASFRSQEVLMSLLAAVEAVLSTTSITASAHVSSSSVPSASSNTANLSYQSPSCSGINVATNAAITGTGDTLSILSLAPACLLLDALAASCKLACFRTCLIKRTQLLQGLTDALHRHVDLLSEPSHSQLIASICCLLHNMFVGDFHVVHSLLKPSSEFSTYSTHIVPDSVSEANCAQECPSKLIDRLLSGIGRILDQPGHGPELRAITVSLAGHLLPHCDREQLTEWCGVIDTEPPNSLDPCYTSSSDPPSSQNPAPPPSPNMLQARARLLLAILDSCSTPFAFGRSTSVVQETKAITKVDTPLKSVVADNRFSGNSFLEDAKPIAPELTADCQLSSHLLSGCLRCLAVCTPYCLSLRYAIGDSRRRVHRLARLLRARLPPADNANINASPSLNITQPRDELLAGNACLVLQQCVADTPMAEHLVGSPVMLDLLSLMQEATRVDARRNAAILASKLAQANQEHRDHLSHLDGFSVLAKFNNWGSHTGRHDDNYHQQQQQDSSLMSMMMAHKLNKARFGWAGF